MSTILYWFRNDLRLEDNPAFTRACEQASQIVPIYIHQDFSEMTHWGFPRVGKHRKQFINQALSELNHQLGAYGSSLLEFNGRPEDIFELLRNQIQSNLIYCEQIEAPEEITQLNRLRNMGFVIESYWQSSMLGPKELPFALKNMPDIFTRFRQDVEGQGLSHTKPIEVVKQIPSIPFHLVKEKRQKNLSQEKNSIFNGGETSALAHITQYFERGLVDSYKKTRNQLIGMDYSSKFSPWLASGCCSPRVIAERLRNYESMHGPNEGTYWLWFELLWRDYFRFLHFKYGNQLYLPKGLSEKAVNIFDENKFLQWSSGQTGEALIDAGMRELYETGFLSNRLRQVVASYWIYDMNGDWRAGAAWFESQLIDYDVYSNQGNWLYIAGRGTDPRGGRPFNVMKQTQDHDPDGIYRAKWLNYS
jgi:deoxyribodipyrimidine photo-lyase